MADQFNEEELQTYYSSWNIWLAKNITKILQAYDETNGNIEIQELTSQIVLGNEVASIKLSRFRLLEQTVLENTSGRKLDFLKAYQKLFLT